MNITKKLILLFLFTNSILFAQKKHELGKVTVEELSQKAHPIDTSAVAAILFEKGEERYEFSDDRGFQVIRNVKMKIKIYKKEGYKYANHTVDYYLGTSEREIVDYSNAATYNLVNGKVEKTKLKSDGEFEEKVTKNFKRKKITLPNVKEGSIIEFEYSLISPFSQNIDRWYFQSNIPSDYSEYTTYIPEFYIFKTSFTGFFTPKVSQEINVKSHTETTTNRESGSRLRDKFEYKETKTTYVFENLPAFKDEKYVNNIRNYLSSIDHELSMIRFPNMSTKSFSTDWEAVTKTIYDNESFGVELNKTGYFESDVTTLIAGLTTNKEKIRTIFNYVKSKVKWNEYYGYYCDEGVKAAYKNGTGNVAEINLMLTAMLRFVGIEANPILVSTRSNGISVIPSRDAYNYVISGVEVENDVILLDATDPYSLPNILPIRDLNWFGQIIRKNGSSANIDLMPKAKSNEIVNVIATISPDGNVEGKVRDQYFDYNAFSFRTLYGEMTEESYLESLEKNLNNAEVNEYSVTGKSELDKPIVENYSFKSNNSVEIIGNKMLFSPLLCFAIDENPFKAEKREYPIDFIYTTQDRYLVNITIPDGYTVETLPASVSIPMSNDIINIKFMISANENKIQISYTKDRNSPIIPAEYYEELKAVYAEIFKKENEKIVLKKI